MVADFVGTASQDISRYGLADAKVTVRTWPCARQVIQGKTLEGSSAKQHLSQLIRGQVGR